MSGPRWVVVAVMGAGACQFSRPADVLPPDAAVDGPACVASTVTCVDDMLTVCDVEGRPTIEACRFGCADSLDRCRDLAPSNGLATYLDRAAGEAAVTLVGDATIDTSSGEVRDTSGLVATLTDVVDGPAVDVLVWPVRTLAVGNVAVTGTRALAIVADGDVVVNGIVSVSARRDLPGAGAVAGETDACLGGLGGAGVSGGAGGGGGGFGTAGGRGAVVPGFSGGVPGAASGDATLVPLRGGCRGGHAGRVRATTQRQPGGGGGALQISTRGAITLQPGAGIEANGGGARGVDAMSGTCISIPENGDYCDTGTGGGAGGGVLLEAASLAMPPTAFVTANGGAGHCGYLGVAENGRIDEMPANGSDCVASSAGTGGDGAAAAFPAMNGTGGPREGGGGGGGAGRIRINLAAGRAFDSGPPILSPQPSLGTCATR